MKKVRIEPGCITCGACAFIAPAVFEVTDIAHVKADADVHAHSKFIQQAIISCPVSVIAYEE